MTTSGISAASVSMKKLNSSGQALFFASVVESAATHYESTASESTGGELDEDALKQLWRRIQQYPLLTSAQEVDLAKRIESGDKKAFDQMVESNLRLVANIARKCRRFAGNSLQLSDLIQEGTFGLTRAVKKFDYRKGYKFSTYASYWIRQAVMRSIAEQGRCVRLPVHMAESISRADRARAALTQELHRPPTKAELASHLQISEKKVQDMFERVNEPMSLDSVMGEEEESVLADFIEDYNALAPDENASLQALREELQLAMSYLTPREQEVITLRYGLDNGQTRTFDQVGEELQLTRERIRQIEKSAINRLRDIGPLQETAQQYGYRSRCGHTVAVA